MKRIKLLSVTLALALCFILTACGGKEAAPMFDQSPPWSGGNQASTETLVYDFDRYIQGYGDEGYKLTEYGRLTYTVKEDKSVAISGDTVTEVFSAGHTLITMDLQVKYKDDLSDLAEFNVAAANLYQGASDKVISYSVMDRYSLKSLFTYKVTDIEGQATNASGEPIDSMNYRLAVNYSDESFGDYAPRSAMLVDKNGTKTASIKSGTYYDSESVYFLVRAMREVKSGGSNSFNLTLAYNDLIEGASKVNSRAAGISSASENSKLEVSSRVLSYFGINPVAAEGEDAPTLECVKTTLSLGGDKGGHGIAIYYAANKTITKTTDHLLFSASKLPVKIEYPNLDRASNALYTQHYTLSSYSNTLY